MHEGHRKRIIERLQSDGDKLQNHELLEILLFNAIPRKNTNAIAHNLLARFGSLKGVLFAELSQLTAVEGVGQSTAAYLKSIGLIYGRVRLSAERHPNLSTFAEVSEYLHERYCNLDSEQLEILCTDAGGTLRYSKSFTSHKAERVQMKPEEVTRFLAAHGTHGIIVAHNHVSGCARPSVEDDVFTAQILAFCSINNIVFHDHVIVAGDACYSYRVEHRLEALAQEFDIAKIVEKRFK